MPEIAEKLAYGFDEPHPEGFDLGASLGGKGKSLALMAARLGLPVPPGFTFTTEACRLFLSEGWSAAHEAALAEGIAQIEQATGRRLGDRNRSLLLSVRSGSSVSMPGMMDTVLNVGLCRAPDGSLVQLGENPALAVDCRHRLEQTFSKALPHIPLPEDALQQVRMAVEGVFRSWNGDRARSYRRIEGIGDEHGTAVTVQAMVFGNMDAQSATGVAFSRDPSTGAPEVYGDVLFTAQGEDVVSGGVHTLGVARLGEALPHLGEQLTDTIKLLERHCRDLVEVEFTIESGVLWMLQYRVGKRSPRAAVRIAHDMAIDPEFPLSRQEAVERTAHLVDGLQATTLAHDPGPPLACGLPASPGVASGALVLTSEAAVRTQQGGQSAILARRETSPSDVEGIAAAAGILTARGGLASHAAVVARGWGKPAVVGCDGLEITNHGVLLGGHTIEAGQWISIDGTSGAVFAGAVEVKGDRPRELGTILEWRDQATPAAIAGTARIDLGDEDLLVLVAVKGFCSADLIMELTGAAPEELAPRLERYARWIDAAKPRFIRATDEGAARAAEIISGYRCSIGAATAISLLAEFAPYNTEVKQLITAWQSKSVDEHSIPNDHQDELYDNEVVERIAAAHQRTVAWLNRAEHVPALAVYVQRLSRAIDQVRAGDRAYIVSPRVDSYHNVWFELHEFLIRLAGRTRDMEEA